MKRFDPATTALIVIDVQNDFCPGGALAVPDGHDVVDPINRLIRYFDNVVLTQDWHPFDHSSFASTKPGADLFSTHEMHYGPQTLWPDHCVQNTRGSDFHDALLHEEAQVIIRKGSRKHVDSYSAFFENDRTTSTGLAGYLRDRGLSDLLLAGLATDFCVAYSALDAQRLGFRTTVAMNACRHIDLNGSLREAERQMEAAGVKLMDIATV